MTEDVKGGFLKNGGRITTLLRLVLGGTGGGMVIAMGIVLAKLIEVQPIAAWRIIEQWGPIFALSVVGLVLFDRRFGQFIAINESTSKAMQELASSVHQMAERDDRRAQATEAAVGFVAQQNEKILKDLGDIKEKLLP